MSILLIDFIVVFFTSLAFFFVIPKVLTENWQLSFSEACYFLIASIVATVFRLFIFQVTLPTVSAGIMSDLDILLNMLLYSFLSALYFYKIKLYSGKDSLILMSFTMLISVLTDFIVTFVINFFPATMRLYPGMEFIVYPFQVTFRLLLINVIAFIISVLFAKSTHKLRKTIEQDSQQQFDLLFCCIFIFASMLAVVAISYFGGYGFFDGVWSWEAISVLLLVSVLLTGFFFYTRFITKKYEQQQKESEAKNLRYYAEELERQHTAIRKFKHDYQNILLSLNSFIEDSDWEGLKQYYSTKVVTESNKITKEHFALEALSRLKVSEIKSILAAKVMMAHNMGIKSSLEINEEIDHIPLDSIALVRMLGIILDNAIEELLELPDGKLWIGCFKENSGIAFITQNCCRSDIPPISQLIQPEFSTKGKGRGIGLSNLLEMANAHHNVMLEMRIADNNFVSKLRITGLN